MDNTDEIRIEKTQLEICSRLKQLRLHHDLNQHETAKKLGIADKSYKNYETNNRAMPLAVIIKFCDIFNCELNWLVFGIDSPCSQQTLNIAGEVAKEIDILRSGKNLKIEPDKLEKYTSYIIEQVITKNSSARNEVIKYFASIS